MKLNPIGSNQTELDLGEIVFLFSYKTPVACKTKSQHVGEWNYYVTDKKWSVTTSRHINKWVGENNSQVNPQSYFDREIEGMK